MPEATIAATQQVALKWLNERFPILVSDGERDIRERVQVARLLGEGEQARLQLITYRGRSLEYTGVKSFNLEVTQRDTQGVPVAYQLVLETAGGTRRLQFAA